MRGDAPPEAADTDAGTDANAAGVETDAETEAEDPAEADAPAPLPAEEAVCSAATCDAADAPESDATVSPCRFGADRSANTPTTAAHTTANPASPAFANVPDFSARASLSNSAMKRVTLGMRVLRSNDSAARSARHCFVSRLGGRCSLKSALRA